MRPLACLVVSLLLCGCSGSGGAENPPDLRTDERAEDRTSLDAQTAPSDLPPDSVEEDVPRFQELELVASAAYAARKAEYLAACTENGGFHGQVCRVAGGETDYNVESIEEALAKVNGREDCADFSMATFVRMLYLDRGQEVLPAETKAAIEDAVWNFRYWLTQPGDDKMCFWSENHQVLFHSAELLVGQLYPDHIFTNTGWTGADHAAHARPLVLRWLELRGRFGFSEWHSNVYFNEDIPALVNLADFAEDEEIRTRAAMVLDLLAVDLLANTYKGHFATTHGRTYSSKFLSGLKDSTAEAAWLMLGLGEYASTGNFSACFLATSSHQCPALLEALANDHVQAIEHRQHDSFDIADGPTWGIGYEEVADVIVWAGLSAIAAPEVIDGMVAMLDEHGLWDGFLFGDIPEPYRGMLKDLAGTPGLVQLATDMEVVSRGIALEGINTYTWRTPHFQLSGAQDFKPGYWAAQTQTWLATLDGEAFVFTSYPGQMEELGTGLSFGGTWIGGWQPRATFHRNVGVIQYRKDSVPMLDDYLTADHIHAFFPRNGFDEVREEGNWVLGRKGDGYVALASREPTVWSDENDYQLMAFAESNDWVVELGSSAEWDSFEAFVEAVVGASLTFGETIAYESPSVGLVTVGWEGPMTVGGESVDLGPFPRFETPFAATGMGSWVTRFERDGKALELDFEQGRRRLLEALAE